MTLAGFIVSFIRGRQAHVEKFSSDLFMLSGTRRMHFGLVLFIASNCGGEPAMR